MMLEVSADHRFYALLVRQIPYLLEATDADDQKKRMASILKILGDMGFTPHPDFATEYELVLSQLSRPRDMAQSEDLLAVCEGPGRPKGQRWRDVATTMKVAQAYIEGYKRDHKGVNPTEGMIASDGLGISPKTWLSIRAEAQRNQEAEEDRMIVEQQRIFEWLVIHAGGRVLEPGSA